MSIENTIAAVNKLKAGSDIMLLPSDIVELVADYERLKAENEKYVKALEHYEDKENWDCSQQYEEGHRCGRYSNCDRRLFVEDAGYEIAQQALNTKGGE